MLKKLRKWFNKHFRGIKVYNLVHEPRNLNLDDIELTGDEIVLILDTEEPRLTSWKKEPNLNLTDLSQTREEMRAVHPPRSSIRKKKSHNTIYSPTLSTIQESTEE